MKIKRTHPLEWLLEEFESDPGFVRRKMFGCEAAYLDTKMVLVLAAGQEPWNGALFPVERENHPAILSQFPELAPHPILGKWLYISQTHPCFEEIASRLRDRVRRRDPLLGVVPVPKKRKAEPGRAAKAQLKPKSKPKARGTSLVSRRAKTARKPSPKRSNKR